MTPALFNLHDSIMIHKKQGIVSRTLDDRVIIMIKEHERPFRFNEAGTHIWMLLETPKTIKELALQLCDRYKVDPEDLQNDLRLFLSDLIEKHLIEMNE